MSERGEFDVTGYDMAALARKDEYHARTEVEERLRRLSAWLDAHEVVLTLVQRRELRALVSGPPEDWPKE